MARIAILLTLLALLSGQLRGQGERLQGRWVGTHLGEALHLDFYGDTMVVVNDRYAAHFRATPDSVIVRGDTAFAVRHWSVLDRLLLETAEGKVITMTRQSILARPIEGMWRGAPPGAGDRTVLLELFRGGTARWRLAPEGSWTSGEWDRRSRVIEFTWLPDSTVWTGRYDPLGEALLFDEAPPVGAAVVLRKVYR